MRKFLMKIALCVMSVAAIVGTISPIVASAEDAEANSVVESVVEGVESVETSEADNVSSEAETSENTANIVEETETSKWFDETLKPLILQCGAEIAAFALVVWIWLKKFGNAKEAFLNGIAALTKSNEENVDTSKAVAELKEEHAKEMAELRKMFVEALNEIKESLTDKVDNADDMLHKLLEVERLAYGSNAKLVNNGTAKRIAEVVGYGKTKNEDEK